MVGRCVVVVFVMAASVLTGGCARHWTKPGGTYEQFVKDSYDCAQQHTSAHGKSADDV